MGCVPDLFISQVCFMGNLLRVGARGFSRIQEDTPEGRIEGGSLQDPAQTGLRCLISRIQCKNGNDRSSMVLSRSVDFISLIYRVHQWFSLYSLSQ